MNKSEIRSRAKMVVGQYLANAVCWWDTDDNSLATGLSSEERDAVANEIERLCMSIRKRYNII